jgi:SagB-type dehydrogenase family enzyme
MTTLVPVGETLDLPAPDARGQATLERALAARRSVREYDRRPLTPAELSQLAWAAQGVVTADGKRTAPSAGGLYPLELYVATAEGLFHYQPAGHRLRRLGETDHRPALAHAALDQAMMAEAGACFVLAAVYARVGEKYGWERCHRYVHLEAGHAAQNLMLEAAVLGLGSVAIGPFEDAAVRDLLGLPADHEPAYMVSVGAPRG